MRLTQLHVRGYVYMLFISIDDVLLIRNGYYARNFLGFKKTTSIDLFSSMFNFSIIFPTFVYYHTKKSSHVVGVDDGSIDARSNLIKTIRTTVRRIYDCREIENKYKLILISNVKTNSLYLFKSENGHDEFCQRIG